MTISLNSVASGYNLSTMNSNWSILENYINTQLLHRRGSTIDEAIMQRNLDMNSFSILNAKVNGVFLDEIIQMIKDTIELQKELEQMMLQLQGMGGFDIGVQIAGFAALRLLNPTVHKQAFYLSGYLANNTIGGGMFYYDATDTTSADDGGRVAVTLTGKRIKRVIPAGGLCVDDFGADPTGASDVTDALQRAVNSVALTNYKVVNLKGTYRRDGNTTITVPDGVTIRGARAGLTQGPQTVLSSPMTTADLDAIHINMTPGSSVPCFTAGRDCTFTGFSFVYINQPRSATSLSQLLVYGPAIWASHSCSVVNMRYVAAWDFFNGRGEAHFLSGIYGYAFNVDYHIEQCADVSRFENIHINSNVYRPDWNVIDLAAPRATSRAFELVQHDGMIFNNIHVFAKGTVFYNRQNSTTRLCTLHGSLFSIDKCGTLIDSDANTATCADLSNGEFIHDYHTNNGALANLSNPVATQVSNYFFKSWKWQLGSPGTSPGQGSWAPYWINFNNVSGTRLWLDTINIPATATVVFNNPANSNRIEGGIILGTRKIDFNPANNNLIPNSHLNAINPFNNIPYGFSQLGTAVTVNGKQVTSTSPTPLTGLGMSVRVDASFTGACTAYVYADSIGDSTGVLLTAYLNDFSNPITFSGTWEIYGNIYLCRVQVNSSVNRTHWDITANAPSATGGILTVRSFHFTAGAPLMFSPTSEEPPLTIQQVGSRTGSMSLVANVPQQIPTTLAGDIGAYLISIRTGTTTSLWMASKRLTGLAGVTQSYVMQAGGEVVTVTWPTGIGVRPTIQSNTTGDISITVTGA